jgi:hypothetical protein
MSWRRRRTGRRSRPKARSLSDKEKEQILGILNLGIGASPVLTALSIRARTLRGRFYFERVWPVPGERPDVEVIGRATPLEDAEEDLLLEAEKSKGNWYTVTRGSAKEVVGVIAGDTKGTFHGLGALDSSLRQGLKVERLDGLRFVHAGTDQECTAQEALFHFFGIPIDILAEPRQWYVYHRQPRIVEASGDRARVLVRFLSHSVYGSFAGTCLYAILDGQWGAYTIKPNQSGDIATALAWLEKRGWRAW